MLLLKGMNSSAYKFTRPTRFPGININIYARIHILMYMFGRFTRHSHTSRVRHTSRLMKTRATGPAPTQRRRSPQTRHEPRETGHGDAHHGEHKAEGPLLVVGQGRAARAAGPPAGERRVGLTRVHAKGQGGVGGQRPEASGGGDCGLGVVYVQCVHLDDERLLVLHRLRLVGSRVPGEGSLGGEGHVGRQRPRRLQGAGAGRGHDVDAAGRVREVRVVPFEGDVVADPVQSSGQGRDGQLNHGAALGVGGAGGGGGPAGGA